MFSRRYAGFHGLLVDKYEAIYSRKIHENQLLECSKGGADRDHLSMLFRTFAVYIKLGITGKSVRVFNVHERRFKCNPEEAARLLDSLSSQRDSLWPLRYWPRMKLDRPLGIGATGGHGPIRYSVIAYEPGKKVTFKFSSPRGFVGEHWFEVLGQEDSTTVLRHTIEMSLVGAALISWPLVIRPLHDALVEDALTNAQVELGGQPTPVAWSMWVRFLRTVVGRRSRRAQ